MTPSHPLTPRTFASHEAMSRHAAGLLTKQLTLKPDSLGLTLGMGEILQSKTILLLISGATKKTPMKRLLEPTIRTEFPGSFLHLHPNVQLLCDRDALP